MQIGAVAKQSGLSVDAVRFYERSGLLSRPPRTEGGFRQYGEEHVEALAFVRRMKGLGFTLREIPGLLALRGTGWQPCEPVRRRLREKLADIQQRLSELHQLEHELKMALQRCNRELRRKGVHCPIFEPGASRAPVTAKHDVRLGHAAS